MTDHIIKAAREAGFVVQRDEWVLQTMLRTFYAIAYRAGMERAAEIAAIHSQYPIENDFDRGYSKGSRDASDRIRAEAHTQNQTEGN